MHNPEFVLENETHKFLRDLKIQTDHHISVRWPDLIIINKKKENFQNDGLCCPSWPQSKVERKQKKKDKNLDLDRELNKLWNIKVIEIPVIIGALVTVTKGLVKGQEG